MVITREISDEIKNSVSKSIQSVLKDDDFINHIVQKVSESVTKSLGSRIAELEKQVKDLNERCENNSSVITELKEGTARLISENEYLQNKYDDIDQKSRLNNLRFFKVKEFPQENLLEVITRHLESNLAIKISREDIVTCSRIGKNVADRPRCILLSLANLNIKQKILNKKKLFKGTGIVVKEDLTEKRLKLMEAAIKKTSLRDVWSYNGLIYVSKDNKKIPVRTPNDLNKL